MSLRTGSAVPSAIYSTSKNHTGGPSPPPPIHGGQREASTALQLSEIETDSEFVVAIKQAARPHESVHAVGKLFFFPGQVAH